MTRIPVGPAEVAGGLILHGTQGSLLADLTPGLSRAEGIGLNDQSGAWCCARDNADGDALAEMLVVPSAWAAKMGGDHEVGLGLVPPRCGELELRFLSAHLNKARNRRAGNKRNQFVARKRAESLKLSRQGLVGVCGVHLIYGAPRRRCRLE